MEELLAQLSNGTGSGDDFMNEFVDILNNSSPGDASSWNGSWKGLSQHTKTIENAVLVCAYSVLFVIAIFGNSLVCYVILKNKRLHTATNFFLANLAVSDLLVTCLNVPFNIVRHVMYDWLFGETLCHLVNFSLMVSTYVSTYTLTSIALDRHRVVLKPLSQRMSKTLAAGLLVAIWVLAVLLSLPFGIYTQVEDVPLIVRKQGVPVISTVRRCRTDYPSPASRFEQYLTVITIVLQYVVPLTLIGVAYGRIVQSLWSRTHVGAVTAHQQMSHARTKRKSIKLLIAVVVVFALCWLPLNLYHLLTDLHPNPEVFPYNSKVFFVCHWVAISSTCYNPFVYCWLNENFREEVKSRFRWCFRCGVMGRLCEVQTHSAKDTKRGRPETSSRGRNSMTSSARATSVRRELTLISDPDELLASCLKQSEAFLTEEEGEREEGELEEERDLLSMHRNGRVEFHGARLHNCVNN